jgi:hypothetical protein
MYVSSPPSIINLQHLNFKTETNRRKTYETWRIPFMDGNQLAAAGFYFTNQSDVVRCAFCGVEVGHWEEWDDVLKEHQRWSPSCGFAKGLCVRNIPILSNDQPEKTSDQPTRSRNMCNPRLELRPNSLPERTKYYYLYFLFCYICVFDNSVLIFNVLLQLQVLVLLHTW